MAGVLAMAAGSASAKSITYVGDYGPDLQFSITTDGAIGPIVSTDILHFDIKSALYPDGDLTDANGQVFFMGDSFEASGAAMTASAQGLSYDFSQSEYDINFEGQGPTNETDLLSIESDGGFASGPGMYVASSPDEAGGALIAESGPTVIANVSAAPEPAAWSLMICGLGLVGGALRLGRRAQATAAA